MKEINYKTYEKEAIFATKCIGDFFNLVTSKDIITRVSNQFKG
jgi:hypothetical protein